MAIFKCKMCGGDLEINEASTVAECIYCGTQQTLPKLDDDRKANLYDRANHFRRNNDFDKAMGIYEQILNTDTTDAEAYWSLVLCHYGIEYVEDPATHKRVPTVNRAQFTSIFDDANYKSALEYADVSQKQIYENEAKAINEIQKGILAISQNEEPFDVFICYKETDANGRRTPDSVLANDLYHQLTQEGFKVFFSRITLEDKLGTAYEPYIFAALNSSKVMVVLGTKPEYFNAVWVKNEWSRYLTLIKSGANKILIPAYKDMDPYDLPEEFSHLQAQDMSKLGFMQDLIRGIKKLTHADEPKATVVKETVVASANNNTAPLLKRAFMFLEDGEWERADDFCEQVLNIDPECADAYLGKLMADLKVKKQDSLKNQAKPFDNSNNYQKAVRFADDNLKAKLKADIEYIKERNENARLEEIYNSGYVIYTSDTTESEYKRASSIFAQIPQYKDAKKLSEECLEKAENAKKEYVYASAIRKMSGIVISNYRNALDMFMSIKGYKDVDDKIAYCTNKIREMEEKAEAERLEREQKAEIERQKAEAKKKLITKISIISVASICLVIAVAILINTVVLPAINYNNAVKLMENGSLNEAYEAFAEIGDYKDAAEKAGEIQIANAKEQFKNIKVGDYIEFGAYEQLSTSNGKEEVEWLVLEVKDDKVLLISKYALDCKLYNTTDTDVTWETCTLRQWLNNDFINSAFSTNEKAMIPTVTVSADKNPDYSTNPGNQTQDQIFLLSITEANKYCNSDSTIQCRPTDYAEANGAFVNSDNDNCWWWLRTPGSTQHSTSYVGTVGGVYEFSQGGSRAKSDSYAGGVSENGRDVNYSGGGIRPAMWIELK